MVSVRRRIGFGSGAVLSLVALGGLLAGPAQAAPVPAPPVTLPAGQTISIVDDDSGQVSSVDPTTAALTFVGGANASGIRDWDVANDGVGYAVGQFGDSSGIPESQSTTVSQSLGTAGHALADVSPLAEAPDQAGFYAANAATGTLTALFDVTSADGEMTYQCAALDLTAGVLAAACSLGEGGSFVGTIDPATGIFTPLVTVALPLDGLATDPRTGILYGFKAGNVQGNDVYVIDLAAGTATKVGSIVGPDGIYGADFDSSGQLWVTGADLQGGSDPESEVDALFTIDTTTWASRLVGDYTAPAGGEFSITDSITIWGAAPVVPLPPAPPAEPAGPVLADSGAPAPALANTGLAALPLGLLAVVALAAGLAVAVFRRRRA